MSEEGQARVLDLKSIEKFKGSMVEFGDTVKVALVEADSEIERAIVWLERDRIQHWRRQIQKRQELVTRAKSALYRKQMQGSEKDGRPSVVDEKVELARSLRQLKSAEERLEHTKRWRNRLEREYAMYKGHIQPLSSMAERDVPMAVTLLGKILEHLEAYASGSSGSEVELARLLDQESKRSMSRGSGDDIADDEEAS
ncbi:MAG TPA: hypothetical protein DCX60_02890 [Phycisphaerales bacterium]|nr:hypothetical protein [Phycisphaerales bacterium]